MKPFKCGIKQVTPPCIVWLGEMLLLDIAHAVHYNRKCFLLINTKPNNDAKKHKLVVDNLLNCHNALL